MGCTFILRLEPPRPSTASLFLSLSCCPGHTEPLPSQASCTLPPCPGATCTALDSCLAFIPLTSHTALKGTVKHSQHLTLSIRNVSSGGFHPHPVLPLPLLQSELRPSGSTVRTGSHLSVCASQDPHLLFFLERRQKLNLEVRCPGGISRRRPECHRPNLPFFESRSVCE